jgi:hypothetical protein
MTTMRRFTSLLLLSLCLCLSTVGAASASSSYKTFSSKSFTITFQYPSNWLTGTVNSQSTAGSSSVAEVALGLDSQDAVIISRYNLTISANAANLPRLQTIVNSVVDQLSGKNLSTKRNVVGGLAALSAPSFQFKDKLINQFTFVFNGAVEYQINCQSTPANQAEIATGCKEILNSVKSNLK